MIGMPAQYQEGKAGVGASWEATLEGGGRSDFLGDFYCTVVQAVLLFVA